MKFSFKKLIFPAVTGFSTSLMVATFVYASVETNVGTTNNSQAEEPFANHVNITTYNNPNGNGDESTQPTNTPDPNSNICANGNCAVNNPSNTPQPTPQPSQSNSLPSTENTNPCN
jgi:hypothetical protein